MTETLNVAYCFDEAFSRYAAVSTHPLSANSVSKLRIFWCVPEHAVARIEQLRSHIKLKGNHIIEVIPLLTGRFASWHTSAHLTVASYYRLLLPDAIPVDRVIYIDADTVVLKDLGDFFAVPLANKVVAGVPDEGGGKSSGIPRAAGDPYLNAGVLVMDLARMRADQFLERCQQIYTEHRTRATWQDQCIINKYAEQRKLVVSGRWNRQIFANSLTLQESELSVSRDYSSVCHFVGPVKPWEEWCNPKIAEFWWSLARNAGIPNLHPVRIARMQQALALAEVCDHLRLFERASQLKSEIISRLMKRLQREGSGR